jgi:hypothetical protein
MLIYIYLNYFWYIFSFVNATDHHSIFFQQLSFTKGGFAHCGIVKENYPAHYSNLIQYLLTLVQPEPHCLPVPLHCLAIHIHMEVPQVQEECHTQKKICSTSKGTQEIKHRT